MFAIGNQIKDAISSVEVLPTWMWNNKSNVAAQDCSQTRDASPNSVFLYRVCQFVSVNMAGESFHRYIEGKAFNLIVRTKDEGVMRWEGAQPDDWYGDGQKIYPLYIADVVSAMGPNTISRENVKRKIVISANTSGRDLQRGEWYTGGLMQIKLPWKDIMWNMAVSLSEQA